MNHWDNAINTTTAYVVKVTTIALMPTFNCDPTVMLTLAFIKNFAEGLAAGILATLINEMTTNFVSTFFAVINAIGTLPGLFVPYLVGLLLESGDNLLHQWNLCYYIAAVSTCIGVTLFVLFCKVEIEPWDTVQDDKCDNESDADFIVYK